MDYPKPLVIPPHSLPHKQTFILLHGRGSSGERFGPALLDSPIPLTNPIPDSTGATNTTTITSLALAFPHARFVFPTAPLRRATVYGRALTHQWFNNWKLDPPATDREDLQLPGLCETTAYLHDLWRSEIAHVPGGAANVIVGGLSQGCAAALVALLLWEGDSLGAMVGICGWLPFAVRLDEHLSNEESESQNQEDEFDPFEREEDSRAKLNPTTQAIAWLREELALQMDPKVVLTKVQPTFKSIPIFLGHGTEDDRVSIDLGRQAFSCLSSLGADVCWKTYKELTHWYSKELLRDLVQFVQAKAEGK